jgi:hypothetical protein
MRQEKMSLKSKRELLAALKVTYHNASYSEKNRLLDGFQTATGYNSVNGVGNARKYGDVVISGNNRIRPIQS